MNRLQVSAEVPALRESLVADVTDEGSLSRVLAEVVSEVARLVEYSAAADVQATVVQLSDVCLFTAHLDHLVQVVWNLLERLRLAGADAQDDVLWEDRFEFLERAIVDANVALSVLKLSSGLH